MGTCVHHVSNSVEFVKFLDRAPLKRSAFRQFVDGTFIAWPHGHEMLGEFLAFMNSLHGNIKFTMEMENNGMLPFLDVLVYRKQDICLGHGLY